ncbi:MAG: sensor histidine kinase, partial [Chloroflexi bacterium]|nr:sensor histidine kinase [Chloroflexota bacterium]
MNTRFRLPRLARLRLRWLAVLLPLGISGVAMILLRSGQLANPILYMRADTGTLLGLLGLIASAGLACAVVIRDRLQQTRQRSAEQALALAADDRRRFLRRLDHELKNPLTAIRAGLANVAEEPTNNVRRDALNSVEAQTMRLSRLAADLRKLAELETRSLERTPVNMAELLQEAMAVAEERPEAGSRHLRLTLPQAPWPLPAVPGDRDLLFLAVHNLLDNAIKFTSAGDTVELRAFE